MIQKHCIEFSVRQKITCMIRLGFLGTADFVPEKLKSNKSGSDEFESFGQTMVKVNAWIAQQSSDINVCNVQRIEYKLESSWGKWLLFYLILNVCSNKAHHLKSILDLTNIQK